MKIPIPPASTIRQSIVWHQHWLADAKEDCRRYDINVHSTKLKELRRWLRARLSGKRVAR